MENIREFTPENESRGLEALKKLSGKARRYFEYMKGEPGADLKLYGYDTEAGEKYAIKVFDICEQDLTAAQVQELFEGFFNITLEWNGEDPHGADFYNYCDIDEIIERLDNAQPFEYF